MKISQIFNNILHMVILLLIGIIVGTILIIAVYCIPTNNMVSHLNKSVSTLEEEGIVPYMFNLKFLGRDNWTDSLMLNIAINDNNTTPAKAAMDNKYITYNESVPPLNDIVDYFNGKVPYYYNEYNRYWHGYLIFLKPFLYFSDYIHIRYVNIVFQPLLVVLIIYLMYKRGLSRNNIIAFILSILFLRPIVIPLNMQFSSMFYLMLVALVILLWKYNYLKKDRMIYYFFILGMAASFFDFLTYPLVTFGAPAVMYLMLNKSETDYIKLTQKIVLYCICWGLGYSLFWASKWIVGSIILERNIVNEAISQVLFRTSTNGNSGEHISYFMTVLLNITARSKGWSAIIVVISALTAFIMFKTIKKKDIIISIPYIFILILPFVWYFVLSNHSYIHYLFTSRILMLSVFAVWSYISNISDKNNILKN